LAHREQHLDAVLSGLRLAVVKVAADAIGEPASTGTGIFVPRLSGREPETLMLE
jgi:hypothetical protein